MRTFLLVDDHQVVRLGMRYLLKKTFPHAEVFESPNEERAINILKEHKIDLVLLDLGLPDSDPINIIQIGKVIQPNIKFLILTMQDAEAYAMRYLKLGVNGYLSKLAPEEEIITAISIIFEGRTYFSEALKDLLTQSFTGKQVTNPFDLLSTREYQIALMIIEGKSTQEIANNLSVSSSTVSTFKSRIYEKMDLKGTSAALLVSLAKRHNIIS